MVRIATLCWSTCSTVGASRAACVALAVLSSPVVMWLTSWGSHVAALSWAYLTDSIAPNWTFAGVDLARLATPAGTESFITVFVALCVGYALGSVRKCRQQPAQIAVPTAQFMLHSRLHAALELLRDLLPGHVVDELLNDTHQSQQQLAVQQQQQQQLREQLSTGSHSHHHDLYAGPALFHTISDGGTVGAAAVYRNDSASSGQPMLHAPAPSYSPFTEPASGWHDAAVRLTNHPSLDTLPGASDHRYSFPGPVSVSPTAFRRPSFCNRSTWYASYTTCSSSRVGKHLRTRSLSATARFPWPVGTAVLSTPGGASPSHHDGHMDGPLDDSSGAAAVAAWLSSSSSGAPCRDVPRGGAEAVKVAEEAAEAEAATMVVPPSPAATCSVVLLYSNSAPPVLAHGRSAAGGSGSSGSSGSGSGGGGGSGGGSCGDSGSDSGSQAHMRWLVESLSAQAMPAPLGGGRAAAARPETPGGGATQATSVAARVECEASAEVAADGAGSCEEASQRPQPQPLVAPEVPSAVMLHEAAWTASAAAAVEEAAEEAEGAWQMCPGHDVWRRDVAGGLLGHRHTADVPRGPSVSAQPQRYEGTIAPKQPSPASATASAATAALEAAAALVPSAAKAVAINMPVPSVASGQVAAVVASASAGSWGAVEANDLFWELDSEVDAEVEVDAAPHRAATAHLAAPTGAYGPTGRRPRVRRLLCHDEEHAYCCCGGSASSEGSASCCEGAAPVQLPGLQGAELRPAGGDDQPGNPTLPHGDADSLPPPPPLPPRSQRRPYSQAGKNQEEEEEEDPQMEEEEEGQEQAPFLPCGRRSGMRTHALVTTSSNTVCTGTCSLVGWGLLPASEAAAAEEQEAAQEAAAVEEEGARLVQQQLLPQYMQQQQVQQVQQQQVQRQQVEQQHDSVWVVWREAMGGAAGAGPDGGPVAASARRVMAVAGSGGLSRSMSTAESGAVSGTWSASGCSTMPTFSGMLMLPALAATGGAYGRSAGVSGSTSLSCYSCLSMEDEEVGGNGGGGVPLSVRTAVRPESPLRWRLLSRSVRRDGGQDDSPSAAAAAGCAFAVPGQDADIDDDGCDTWAAAAAAARATANAAAAADGVGKDRQLRRSFSASSALRPIPGVHVAAAADGVDNAAGAEGGFGSRRGPAVSSFDGGSGGLTQGGNLRSSLRRVKTSIVELFALGGGGGGEGNPRRSTNSREEVGLDFSDDTDGASKARAEQARRPSSSLNGSAAAFFRAASSAAGGVVGSILYGTSPAARVLPSPPVAPRAPAPPYGAVRPPFCWGCEGDGEDDPSAGPPCPACPPRWLQSPLQLQPGDAAAAAVASAFQSPSHRSYDGGHVGPRSSSGRSSGGAQAWWPGQPMYGSCASTPPSSSSSSFPSTYPYPYHVSTHPSLASLPESSGSLFPTRSVPAPPPPSTLHSPPPSPPPQHLQHQPLLRSLLPTFPGRSLSKYNLNAVDGVLEGADSTAALQPRAILQRKLASDAGTATPYGTARPNSVHQRVGAEGYGEGVHPTTPDAAQTVAGRLRRIHRASTGILSGGTWSGSDAGTPRSGAGNAAGAAPIHPGGTMNGSPCSGNSLGRDLPYAEWHPCVSVLFADICGFTQISNRVPAVAVMEMLNALYCRLDALCASWQQPYPTHGSPPVYKVQIIGDAYMVATGLLQDDPAHAANACLFAMACLREAGEVLDPCDEQPLRLRVGVHSGPVVSGVVGRMRRQYSVFGDTVNVASRMESTGAPGAIHVSEETQRLAAPYMPPGGVTWRRREGVEVKGKGTMNTFWLEQPAGLGSWDREEAQQQQVYGEPPPQQQPQQLQQLQQQKSECWEQVRQSASPPRPLPQVLVLPLVAAPDDATQTLSPASSLRMSPATSPSSQRGSSSSLPPPPLSLFR